MELPSSTHPRVIQEEHDQERGVDLDRRLDGFEHSPGDEVQVDDTVEEEQEEVLVVREAHAVVDPCLLPQGAAPVHPPTSTQAPRSRLLRTLHLSIVFFSSPPMVGF